MKQQTQINKNEWKEIALGDKDYFEIVGSGINRFTGEKEYLSTESIKGTKIEKIECKIKYNNKLSRANMQPLMNSIWFAKMQATLKVYAFTKDNEKEINQYILSTGFAGIKVLNKYISPEYVRIYLTTDKFNLEKDKLCTGSTQRGINNSFIIKIKIPLPFLPNGTPNLKEQERIVKILEENERQLKRADRAEELFNEYLKSVFNEMFHNKGFLMDKLSKLIIEIENKNPAKEFPKSYFNYIDISSLNNITKKIISTTKILGENAPSRAKQQVKTGDIIISTVRPNLNAVALIDKKLNNQICSTGFCVLRVNTNKVIPEYVFMIITDKKFVESMTKIARGASYPAVSDKDILNFKTPLPPLPLQQKFSRIVEHVEKMKENVNKTKQNAEELFSSLMQKAFRGEL